MRQENGPCAAARSVRPPHKGAFQHAECGAAKLRSMAHWAWHWWGRWRPHLTP